MIRKATLMTAAAAVLALGACDSPLSTSGDARVTVLLTDAPHEYLDAAVVSIGRIELLPEDGPPVVITTDGGTYDLLQLQDGVTAALGTATIEAGRYLEMRLLVSDASLTLKEPYTYTDGSTTRSAHVPSGAQTGIKIKLRSSGSDEAGVEIRPGETTLVVDFDVSQNFVMQGNANTPAGIQGFLFTPVLRAVVDDVAGSIAGSVTAPEGVETEGLSVVAVREGAGEDDVPATTLVKDDGTFQIHFLAPGTYNVTVASVPEGHVVNTVQVTVGNAAHVTGVELEITAE